MKVPYRLRRWLRKMRHAAHEHQHALPKIDFDEVFPAFGERRLCLERVAHYPAGVRLNELLYIAFLANRTPQAQVFEIGTSLGRTTLNIALNLQPRGRVYSLDLAEADVQALQDGLYAPAQEAEVQDLVKGDFVAPYLSALPITLVTGESTAFDFSPWYGQIDLVFIDGGHTTKVLESDTQNAFEMLRPEGGIILWHDYLLRSCPEVYHFLNELGVFYPLYHIAGTKTVMYCSDPAVDLKQRRSRKPARRRSGHAGR